MALINLKNVTVGFGNPPLIDSIDLQIEEGARICLVGRNGAGKSTLMKVLSGELQPDGGEITRAPGLNVSMLPQEVPALLKGTVFDVITEGLGEVSGLLARYHQLAASLGEGGKGAMAEFEKVQHEDVGVEVIQKGLGNVTEGDVTRAVNSPPSVVYAFNVVVTPQAALLARDKNIRVQESKIIYELFDDVVAQLNILVPPEVITTHLGEFETVAVFRTEPGRMVVGGKVTEGKVAPGEKAKVWRGEEPLGIGTIDSLQAGKQAAKEAHAGQECGISFKGKVKLQPGDRLEVYHEEVKERKIVLQR